MRRCLGAVVLLSLAACGQQAESPPAATPAGNSEAAPSREPEPEPLEGPVSGGAHSWADGMTANVTSIAAVPTVDPEYAGHDTEITVVVEFSNTGPAVLSFGDSPNQIDSGPDVDLLYGVNRTEAQSWFVLDNTLPTRLTPGTSAAWTARFTLPAATELSVRIAPSAEHPAWTFTEAETLLG